jgi:anthranilate phosphoribosyltransferase
VPTTFNFLGPLANPARPVAQAIGCADARMAPLMAGVIAARGHRGIVFHGADGLDELTTTTDSQVWIVRNGQVAKGSLDPADLGLARAVPSDLVGGAPEHNAQVVRDLVAGAKGPVRDIVLLNAAAAALAFAGADPATPLAPQLAPKLVQAAEAIDSGAASALLQDWVAASQAARAA